MFIVDLKTRNAYSKRNGSLRVSILDYFWYDTTSFFSWAENERVCLQRFFHTEELSYTAHHTRQSSAILPVGSLKIKGIAEESKKINEFR